jgi:hypothetical protein
MEMWGRGLLFTRWSFLIFLLKYFALRFVNFGCVGLVRATLLGRMVLLGGSSFLGIKILVTATFLLGGEILFGGIFSHYGGGF